MLRFLDVRHLAVIDHLQVEFEPGLNVLTGETGAGKSVLIEAIDLLVGGRASADLVRTGEQTATVQAVFEAPDGREVIVRREVSTQGRSRGFIDDALATTAALKDLGSRLVELHGQHEHHGLLDPTRHLQYLDAFIDASSLVDEVGRLFEAWRQALAMRERSQLDEREKKARIEMAEFQLQEIDRVAPVAGEDERLRGERAVLVNADRLSRLSAEAYGALYEGEHAALSSLAGVWRRLAELSTVDPRFTPFLDQRDGVKSALEDLAFFLRSYASDIDASPERLQLVEDRLAALDRLMKKYGPTFDALLARRAALTEELADLGAGAERAADLEARERSARERFLERARELSAIRREGAGRLTERLERALAGLAMPHCHVELPLHRLDMPEHWTASGIDTGEIYLSPNPGEELRPLARIASGGELSRIMLALHTLTGIDEGGRTLVFDEVDAGIGGAAADAVGAQLQVLSRRGQVLCITHLAQIAARADAHFALTKAVRDGRTTAAVARLDQAAREHELARMIAGVEVSDDVLASARDLLRRRAAAGESESEYRSKGESESRAKAKRSRRG
jgi:DNA repair protein RecN (Recombination protein N)